MKSVLLSFLLLCFVGCGSIKYSPAKSGNRTGVSPSIAEKNMPDQVEMGLNNKNEINDGVPPQLIQNEETVRLGDRGGDIFTPVEDFTIVGQGVSKKIRIGLSFGPGLYRTINYVSLLKFLERQNLPPQIVTGTGFGAIVAAMYASGMTPEVIEWNFYRYFKEKRKYRPYDEEWFEEVDSLLIEKIKSKNIQDTPKRFFMTLYNIKTKKTYYFDKGNIRELLLMNLKLGSMVEVKDNGPVYTAAFENEVFNAGLMKRLGVDFAIGADVLGNKFDFEVSNEFLIGVYGKTAGRIQKQKKGFDYFYSIPVSNMSLDSTDNGALYLLKTQEYVEAQSGTLKKLIQKKISTYSNVTE